MATNDSNEKLSESAVTFTAAGAIYQVHPDAKTMDVQDHLSAKLSQLSAMLLLIYGGGFESFNDMNETHRNNYLWSCFMVADECKELVGRL